MSSEILNNGILDGEILNNEILPVETLHNETQDRASECHFVTHAMWYRTSRGEGCQCPCCHAHRDFAQRPQPPVSRPRPYPPRCVDSAYPAPFDECCPYCTNLERQRPMLYHDEYSNRNRDRRDFSTVAMGPGGFMPTLAGPGSEVLQTRLPQVGGKF
eukprot:Gregarina_sp_Poly_1__10291@NODE_723_length_6600_cov_64_797949_g543_i0_p4_GENE_NODE_723_length_6600_cov_64_797949_g543_i0NODE_723_length_6600_cov_64_797949_g543_i0_p4_ORF_typecomplete_len158_score8_12_NODE_723_length_6600_cov_64_797949_g543_i0333806